MIDVPQHDVTNMERFSILNDAFRAALNEGITQRFVEVRDTRLKFARWFTHFMFQDAVQILLDAIDEAEVNTCMRRHFVIIKILSLLEHSWL